MWWKYCACLTVLVLGVSCADKTETVGGIITQVLGQSGKIKVYKEGENASAGVTITMDAIKELTSDDADINSHEFNTFASQDFIFSPSEQTQYPDSDVNVTQFNFMANVTVGMRGNTPDGTAKLTSYVYIFSSDGNITVDGQNFTVKAGMMKFNVKIEDWPFCGSSGVTCTPGNQVVTGTNLDFYLEIKGQGSQPNSTDEAKTYDLGNGATVVVPEEVVYTDASGTNATETMPTGYPKLEIKGGKSKFIFRFRAFQGSALYDPTVYLGDSETPPEPEVEDKTLDETESGVTTKVLGKSGKMTFSNKKGKIVTVELNSLKEMGDNDAAIQDNEHSLNTFANKDFTFSQPMEENYPGTNLGTKKLTFTSSVAQGSTHAKVTVDMYIFKKGGNITNGDEVTTVHMGDMKFTVDIENWKFCGDAGITCTPAATGTSLDLDIVMKGKAGGNANKKNAEANAPDVYDLGDGMVYMSKKYDHDTEMAIALPQGYPKLEMVGPKQVFRLKFNKFTSKIHYDPQLSLDGTNDPSGSGSMAASLAVVLASVFMAALGRML